MMESEPMSKSAIQRQLWHKWSDELLEYLFHKISDELLARDRFEEFPDSKFRLGWVREPGGIFHEVEKV